VEFDISDLGGIGDIFSSIFGTPRRRRRPRTPRPKRSRPRSRFRFRVAALGGAVPIQPWPCLRSARPAADRAAPRGATVNTCPECKGRGTVFVRSGWLRGQSPRGPVLFEAKGTVPVAALPDLSGQRGKCASRENGSTSTFPAGIEEGTRLRLKNQGPKGRGDLMVEIHIAPDRFFPSRKGLDLIGVVPINLAQSAARLADQSEDARRQSVVVLRYSVRDAARPEIPHSGPWHREEWPPRRHVRRSARHAPREAHCRGSRRR